MVLGFPSLFSPCCIGIFKVSHLLIYYEFINEI
nr:MAG TPA: hypothetical protein [Caudoviricetes sp.]